MQRLGGLGSPGGRDRVRVCRGAGEPPPSPPPSNLLPVGASGWAVALGRTLGWRFQACRAPWPLGDKVPGLRGEARSKGAEKGSGMGSDSRETVLE